MKRVTLYKVSKSDVMVGDYENVIRCHRMDTLPIPIYGSGDAVIPTSYQLEELKIHEIRYADGRQELFAADRVLFDKIETIYRSKADSANHQLLMMTNRKDQLVEEMLGLYSQIDRFNGLPFWKRIWYALFRNVLMLPKEKR